MTPILISKHGCPPHPHHGLGMSAHVMTVQSGREWAGGVLIGGLGVAKAQTIELRHHTQ